MIHTIARLIVSLDQFAGWVNRKVDQFFDKLIDEERKIRHERRTP